MRVIAGKFRSRPLHSLRGLDLRPTADRLRETLFNVLSAGDSTAFEGKVWLDLCAGTGAVGIEALSRGAVQVYFVESSPPAARLISRNLQSLGLVTGFTVLNQDVVRALPQLEEKGVSADFIFLDPPYRLEKVHCHVLLLLSHSQLLNLNPVVVTEHDRRFDPGAEFPPLHRYRLLQQGDAALSFYRLRGHRDAGPPVTTPAREVMKPTG